MTLSRTILAVLLGVPLSLTQAARYPQLLRLQGRFTDSKVPLTDTLPVRFTIWDTEDGYGNLLWEDIQNVSIRDDNFQVVLGRSKPITPSVFSGGDRWVELQLGSDAPMRPRHWIPGKALQTQVAAERAVPPSVPVAPAPPPMTAEEKHLLELQIEKYKEVVVQEAPPAPVAAAVPVAAPQPKPKPAPRRKPAVQPSNDSGTQGPVYEVQSGDTLKSIAEKLYGNAELWYDLYYLNRDRLGPMGHLFTGQILVLPVKTPGEHTR